MKSHKKSPRVEARLKRRVRVRCTVWVCHRLPSAGKFSRDTTANWDGDRNNSRGNLNGDEAKMTAVTMTTRLCGRGGGTLSLWSSFLYSTVCANAETEKETIDNPHCMAPSTSIHQVEVPTYFPMSTKLRTASRTYLLSLSAMLSRVHLSVVPSTLNAQLQ